MPDVHRGATNGPTENLAVAPLVPALRGCQPGRLWLVNGRVWWPPEPRGPRLRSRAQDKVGGGRAQDDPDHRRTICPTFLDVAAGWRSDRAAITFHRVV